ncbi:hypothetical protein [Streptomyces hydrogenans]|uniref:hypothetical protein n=1 Tax=Streptomyces hydrogenans TaxID=1873719 RepID=UPI003824302D
MSCHLCDGPALAPTGLTVLWHPALGESRHVALCEPCRTGRPARDAPDLGPADFAWSVLTRDAHTLHQQYKSGQWHPDETELRFAGDLARLQWSEASVQNAQRTAPPGRLSLLLYNLAFVLRHTPAHDPALLPVRHLVDTLTDHQPLPATTPLTSANPGEAPGNGTQPGENLLGQERHAGHGRHRKPQQSITESPGPGRVPGTGDPLGIGGLPPTPPARHRKPRADDPMPEGVTPL